MYVHTELMDSARDCSSVRRRWWRSSRTCCTGSYYTQRRGARSRGYYDSMNARYGNEGARAGGRCNVSRGSSLWRE
ncbi:hypothetical protein BS78_10G186800 [Paspalum vaginatum]|nr:hypothetical protein BS78_10G186800 [Paspalum vaginatum]